MCTYREPTPSMLPSFPNPGVGVCPPLAHASPASCALICNAKGLDIILHSAREPPMNHSFGCPLGRHIALISPSSSRSQTSLHRSAILSPTAFRSVVFMLSKPVARTTTSASSSRPSARTSELEVKPLMPLGLCSSLILPSMRSCEAPTSM